MAFVLWPSSVKLWYVTYVLPTGILLLRKASDLTNHEFTVRVRMIAAVKAYAGVSSAGYHYFERGFLKAPIAGVKGVL